MIATVIRVKITVILHWLALNMKRNRFLVGGYWTKQCSHKQTEELVLAQFNCFGDVLKKYADIFIKDYAGQIKTNHYIYDTALVSNIFKKMLYDIQCCSLDH